MAKQRYYTDPSRKLMEAYSNFSGGMNSVLADDQMSDSELRLIKNGDVSERGTLQKRGGHQLTRQFTWSGEVRGSRYYTPEAGTEQFIAVVDDKVYKDDDLVFTFPTPLTRTVDLVEFQRRLYLATEQGLHQWDGTTLSKVEAKRPSALEYLYVGANALADEPEYYIKSENESVATMLDGAVVQPRYGTANEVVNFMPIFRVPNPADDVRFRLEYLLPDDSSSQEWRLYKEYTKAEATAGKGMTYTPKEIGTWKFRVLMRNLSAPPIDGDNRTEDEKWQQDSFQFQVPEYQVRTVVDPKDNATDSTAGIYTCNRARVYKNRLYLYGSEVTPDAVYISHINEADYFPQTQMLKFANTRNEPLRNLIEFRDSIIAFTDTSIQTLYGNDADTWRRVVLNTDVGSPFPFGATVINNYVAFVSSSNVYILKSLYSAPEQMNVQKVDASIRNMLEERLNDKVLMIDLQGQLVVAFPDTKDALRWDYDLNSWVYDTSELVPARLFRYQNVSNMLTHDGGIYRLYAGAKRDGEHLIEFEFQTRQFTFGEPFIIKKLRQLHVQMLQGSKRHEVYLTVYADEQPVVSPFGGYHSIVNDTIEWVQTYDPNLVGYGGTMFGEWTLGKSPFGDVNIVSHKLPANGKCRRVSVHMRTLSEEEFKLFRLGFVYKAKKP